MTSEIINKKQNYQISHSIVWIIYLIAYLALGLLPAVKYSIPYIIAGSFAMLPMAIVSLKHKNYRMILIALATFGFFHGLLTYVTGNGVITELINEPVRYIRYFVPCLLFYIVSKMERKKQIVVWIIASVLIGFVIIKTLIALESDPMIARTLARGVSDSDLMVYRMDNIGGFGNCYAVCITFGLWVYLMFNSKLWMRIVSVIMLVFIFYFTIQAQYMIMLLLCVLAFIAVVVLCAKKLSTKILATLFVFCILLLMPMLLRWIAGLGVEGEIYRKLINFAGVLDGTVALSDSTSRIELYKAAFIDFIKSPIWGTWSSQVANDSHSTILIIASTTGILGLCCYSYSVYKCYKVTRDTLVYNNVNTKIFAILFVVFLILALVNPIHYIYEISIVVFLYIPLTLMLFSEKVVVVRDDKKDI